MELKDKLKTEIAINESNDSEVTKEVEKDMELEDAISALQVLGYSRKEIEKVFEKIEVSEYTVEDLIKKGLQLLGKV